MADDIVERLRTIIATPHGVDIWTTTALEAANEIERLRSEVDRLADALGDSNPSHPAYQAWEARRG